MHTAMRHRLRVSIMLLWPRSGAANGSEEGAAYDGASRPIGRAERLCEESERHLPVRVRVAADGEVVVQPIGDQITRRHLEKVPKDAAAAPGCRS